MTDSEWIANIHNFSNAEIFEQLEQIGCDGYYRDIWSACIEELQRRVNNPSGDLISREDLLKELNEYNESAFFDCEAVKDLIDNAPTVEEPERPQGEWIKVKENRMSIDMSGDIVTQYRCSKCGRVIATLPSKLAEYYPFCHCGADMRGEES